MTQLNWINQLSASLLTQEARAQQSKEKSTSSWQKQHNPSHLKNILMQQRAIFHQDDMAETLENMSLVMGGKLKGLKLDQASSANTSDAALDTETQLELLQIIQTLDTHLDPQKQQYLKSFHPTALNSQTPMQTLLNAGLSPIEVAIVLAQILSYLDPQKNKRIKADFFALCTQHSDLIAAYLTGLNQLPCAQQDLIQIQEALLKQPVSLMGIYQKIKNRRDRKSHLKWLIHRFALDLVRTPEADLDAHLIHLLDEIRRLLILLGFDEQCRQICANIKRAGGPDCDPSTLIEIVLNAIDQTWFHSNHFLQHLAQIGIENEDVQYIAIRRIYELIQFLPDICFTDNDQKLQMLESMHELLQELSN